MFWYFGLIEFIQLAQYAVADQCDNPVNQALTYIAYMHVALQPLVVNNYFWAGHSKRNPELVKLILRLCTLGGVLMLFRLPGMPLGLLGDKMNKWLPDLPPSSMHGKGCHYLESSCGPKLCSITGGAWGHISWTVPLLPTTYFVPGASLHGFLFFGPTMVAGGGVRLLLMFIGLAFGPVFAMFFSRWDMATYAFEWPTIWCFFAAFQSSVALFFEMWYPEEFAPLEKAPAGPRAAAAAANGVKKD